jgi:hypothetical protein
LKLRIASLTIICLALAAIPAWAGYDNGPINGTTDAWTINSGYIVSDSYVAEVSGATYWLNLNNSVTNSGDPVY